MDTPALIVSGYRRLLNTKKRKEVSIAEICKEAGISRNTFYKHYKDKQNVMFALLNEDIIEPTIKLKNVMHGAEMKSARPLLLENAFTTIFENRIAYENLLSQLGIFGFTQLWIEVVLAYIYPLFATYNLPPDEREFGAHFIATAQAMAAARWIENGFDLKPNRLAKLCITWTFAHYREKQGTEQFGLPW